MAEYYTVTFDGQVEAVLTHNIQVKIKGQEQPNEYPVSYVIMPDHADTSEGIFKGWALSDTGNVYPKGTTVFVNKSMSFKPVYIKQLDKDIPWTARLENGKFDIFPYDVDTTKFMNDKGEITEPDEYSRNKLYSLELPYNDIYLTNSVYDSEYNNWERWGIMSDSDWVKKNDTLLVRKFYPYSNSIKITLPNTLTVIDSITGRNLSYEKAGNNRIFTLVDNTKASVMSNYSLKSFTITRNSYNVSITTTEESN